MIDKEIDTKYIKDKIYQRLLEDRMNSKKYFCVISHTHWDREWYMPFEQFRVRLVELVDRLFSILDKNPEYIFHLDAQTIVLEDYLEIRPWRRETLVKYISEGNILVGPWFLQNDFYLTSGEATIRNLTVGTKIASEFGKCSMSGYAPDQFGNISQLPQILNQFGIDNFIFGRGYGKYKKDSSGNYIKDTNGNPVREKSPTEFVWEGPDGSRVLAIHMKYWYNNAQRIYSETDEALKLLGNIEEMFEGFAVTPYLLLMNGVDHLEAQDDVLSTIASVGKRIEGGGWIKQCRLDEYVSYIKEFADKTALPLKVYKGELRDGHDWEILKGTLSSRVYVKQQNCRAQCDLESSLEPMSAMYELAGANGSYDRDYLYHLWKQLLKNHPHDSICGCSRDEVHDHMEDNFAKIKEASDYLILKKSDDICSHAQINSSNPDENILCLINTTGFRQNGVIQAEAIFLASDNISAFDIVDINGNMIEFVVTQIENRKHDVFTALNLPGVLSVKVFKFLLYDSGTNGFSVRGLKFIMKDSFDDKQLSSTSEFAQPKDFPVVLKNEHLEVSIDSHGEVTIDYLDDGRHVTDAIYIEDRADRGDAYVFIPSSDKPIYSREFPAKISVIEFSDLRKTVRIKKTMCIPAKLDFKAKCRSTDTIECPITLDLTLDKASSVLKVDVSMLNNAKDHRMRLMVDTGIASDISFADIPFDIVEHNIEPEYPATYSNVHPNTSFAGIQGENVGTAIFTYGNHEYEHISSRNSVLAFTLFRSTGFISMGENYEPGSGPQWEVPGNQCLRKIKGSFGISGFTGEKAELAKSALAFRVPVHASFASCDKKKFAGGRFAIQGSDNPKFYYLPDIYSETKIKDNISAVEVNGNGILVTAFKKSNYENNFVIRAVNLCSVGQTITVRFDGRVIKCSMKEQDDKEIFMDANTNEYRIDLRAKEIITLKLQH